MLTQYPVINQQNIDRQGEYWWTCDVASCEAEVQIDLSTTPTKCPKCGQTVDGKFCSNCGTPIVPAVPSGWVTNHPGDDPLQGAAQFCPNHSSRVVPIDPDAVVVEPTE